MASVDFMTVEEQYSKFKGFYSMHDTCMPVLWLPPQGTTILKMVVASELMTNMLEYFLDDGN